MDPILIAVFIVAGLFAIVSLAIVFRFISLWMQTIMSGCPIPLLELILMRHRRLDPHTIAVAYINARKAGIDVSVDQLQTHALAGGNVMNVVKGLVIAKSADMDLDWPEAARLDLTGHDLEAEMRSVMEASRGL